MCKQCADACRDVFPEVPVEEMSDFLLATTCFPFGSPEDVRLQLQQNRAKMTSDDWRECYAIADREMEEAMKAVRDGDQRSGCTDGAGGGVVQENPQ